MLIEVTGRYGPDVFERPAVAYFLNKFANACRASVGLPEEVSRSMTVQLSQIVKTDVPAFNQVVKEQNIPAIVVKPESVRTSLACQHAGRVRTSWCGLIDFA